MFSTKKILMLTGAVVASLSVVACGDEEPTGNDIATAMMATVNAQFDEAIAQQTEGLDEAQVAEVMEQMEAMGMSKIEFKVSNEVCTSEGDDKYECTFDLETIAAGTEMPAAEGQKAIMTKTDDGWTAEPAV